MHSHENWDDLRFILAVAETGSVSAAARKLGVNHATVLRRVSAYEERQGIDIFDKTSRGYRVIEDRLRVITAAREVENAIQAVDRAVQGTQAPLQGKVKSAKIPGYKPETDRGRRWAQRPDLSAKLAI